MISEPYRLAVDGIGKDKARKLPGQYRVNLKDCRLIPKPQQVAQKPHQEYSRSAGIDAPSAKWLMMLLVSGSSR